MHNTMSVSDSYKPDDVAIIGIAGRFPEADNLETFWSNLVSSRESIREFPESRREELNKIFENMPRVNFIKAGYLDNTIPFEPEIFSISLEESKYLDPEHRLLLELVEESVLDSGYNPEELSDKYVGVFVGKGDANYTSKISRTDPMALVNAVPSINAARVSYSYNFRGPSLTIEAACSSSMVAIHYACQSLKLSESDMAIAGGTEIIFMPGVKEELEHNHILSNDQKVRTFDEGASGTVQGEGGAIIVLKLLNKALDDGDNILAVIKGSAVNSNGGWSNGILAPSEKGQSEVMLRAIKNSKIEPGTLSYIETHGTGTKIGDPIEVAAISAVLTELGYGKQSVAIGSLKPNIGHLNPTSGAASIIKMVLALKNKKIPASINFSKPNSLIEFENAPVYINDKLSDWNSHKVRRAGVSATGFTGVNCHIIMEERPHIEKQAHKNSENIVMLSARTEKSLDAIIEKLGSYLADNKDCSIDDVAYTLNRGRRSYNNKFAAVVHNNDDLIGKLSSYSKKGSGTNEHAENHFVFKQTQQASPSPIFIFPDMEDANFTGVEELYEKQKPYKKHFDGCLKEIEDQMDIENTRVRYIIHLYSYSRLLESYSIKPKAVLGFGMGDAVASLVMGKISLNECIRQVKEYNHPKKVIGEKEISDLVNKVIKANINTFILFPSATIPVKFERPVRNSDSILVDLKWENSMFYKSIIELIKNGIKVDWGKVYQYEDRKRISLPGYVFDRKMYFSKLKMSGELNGMDGDSDSKDGESQFNCENDNMPIKERLNDMLCQVFSFDESIIGAHAYDLGMDSIGLMQFSAKVKKHYNIDVPLKLFFGELTIKQIFSKIEEIIISTSSGSNIIKKQPEREYYPVSCAQKRMFIMDKLSSGSASYNIPGVLMVEGTVDRENLERTFKKLIERHESFRTSFGIVEGETVQFVHKHIDFKIDYMEGKEEAIDNIVKEFIHPFDLGKAPLFRAGIVRLTEDRHVLLLDIHHIISDGISMVILIKDLADIYKGITLPELAIQYRDFSAWQNEMLQTDVIKKQEEYWLNTFSGNLPSLNLPIDFPRPPVQSFEGANIEIKPDFELTKGLYVLASESGATLFMVLLGAYYVLLSKCTGEEDIVVGSPIEGRRHTDLENIIGMFVNTLAIRNFPKADKTFGEFLKEVKENALRAFENQDYQFEQLVEKLEANTDMSRNPLFSSMFAMQNMDRPQIEINNLKLSPYSFESQTCKIDLELEVFEESNNELIFSFVYCTKLFNKSTVEKIKEGYIKVLETIVDNKDIKIKDIELVNKDFEFEDIVIETVGFNF